MSGQSMRCKQALHSIGYQTQHANASAQPTLADSRSDRAALNAPSRSAARCSASALAAASSSRSARASATMSSQAASQQVCGADAIKFAKT